MYLVSVKGVETLQSILHQSFWYCKPRKVFMHFKLATWWHFFTTLNSRERAFSLKMRNFLARVENDPLKKIKVKTGVCNNTMLYCSTSNQLHVCIALYISFLLLLSLNNLLEIYKYIFYGRIQLTTNLLNDTQDKTIVYLKSVVSTC